MFQTSQRGVGNSLVHVCHYAFSILVSQASPVGLAKVGWRYYILFICTNTVAGFVFFFCYPETRGKSLEGEPELPPSHLHSYPLPTSIIQLIENPPLPHPFHFSSSHYSLSSR